MTVMCRGDQAWNVVQEVSNVNGQTDQLACGAGQLLGLLQSCPSEGSSGTPSGCQSMELSFERLLVALASFSEQLLPACSSTSLPQEKLTLCSRQPLSRLLCFLGVHRVLVPGENGGKLQEVLLILLFSPRR